MGRTTAAAFSVAMLCVLTKSDNRIVYLLWIPFIQYNGQLNLIFDIPDAVAIDELGQQINMNDISGLAIPTIH